MLDEFTKILGTIKILLTLFIAFKANPPLLKAVQHTFAPEKISLVAIVTIVGGTVGGYLTFSGAHRLLDAGIKGKENLRQVNKSALTGILLTAAIRFLLFLAAFGVIALGMTIDDANPPASVFQNAAGNFGYRVFGVVMWAASITSVVGAAFTSVSFFKTFNKKIDAYSNYVIVGFIVISAAIFLTINSPVTVLIWAGTINGFILPVGLALILLASRKKKLLGDYIHPLALQIAGWAVVVIMLGFTVATLLKI